MLIETYWKDFLVLILFGCGVNTFKQNDYTIEEHYLIVEYYNTSYVENLHARNVRPNRTCKGYTANFHALIDFGGDALIMRTKGFRFINNQPTHLLFQLDVKICEAMAKNMFGVWDILNTGNITHCPVKKGYYYMNSFGAHVEKFPPLIPPGRYRLQLLCMYHGSTIATLSFYGNLVYKIKY